MAKISVIIPCFYNEGNIPVTSKVLIENESKFPKDVTFEYVMVDDGSKDNTWAEILKFQEQYPSKVKAIKLTRNFGAINADLAGFDYATGDCNVILSCDLQDPPELILEMYDYWCKGLKLVVAHRTNREESFIQKLISNTTHKLFKKLALPEAPEKGFDMVLFDAELREKTKQANVRNTYLQHYFIFLGYPYASIPYVRRKREIGSSKWTMAKKMKAFIDSFVSFSYFPIRVISVVGLVLGAIAFLYAMLILYWKIFGEIEVEGWATHMLVILFVGSFQMIALGIIGEYVWRTLDETRNRPTYIVEQTKIQEEN